MTGDKFMPDLHLKQLEFTYSVCGSFIKHCERIQKFRETVKIVTTKKMLVLFMMQHILIENSDKAVIKKLKRIRVFVRFKYNI